MTPLRAMDCKQVRAHFADYIDGTVNGLTMLAISTHFDTCPACHHEFSGLRDAQASLALLGHAPAPASLAHNLTVAINAQRDMDRALELAMQRNAAANSVSDPAVPRPQRGLFHAFSPAALGNLWQDSIGPVFYRAAGGAASTAVLLGAGALLFGALSTPTPLIADDQPAGNDAAPRYLYSTVVPQSLTMDHDDNLLVEAYVNSQGHIYDYRILSGPDTPAIRSTINDRLLFSVYQPAQIFGQPVRGRVLISFAGISVHG